jgi:hypothetical protein
VFEVAEQLGELELASFRGAGIAIGDRFPARLPRRRRPIGYAEANRHVGGDDLPYRARLLESRLEPLQLLAAEKRGGGRLQRMRADQAVRLFELFVVRPVDQHPRRSIAAAPDHHRSVARVAELQALQRLWSFAIGCDNGRRALGQGPSGQRDAGRRSHAGLQKPAPRRRMRFAHDTLLPRRAGPGAVQLSGLVTLRIACNGREGNTHRERKFFSPTHATHPTHMTHPTL